MAGDGVNILQPGARQADQAVGDAQVVLAGDDQLVLQEQVVVAVDAAGQRILDRNEAAGGCAAVDRGKDRIE